MATRIVAAGRKGPHRKAITSCLTAARRLCWFRYVGDRSLSLVSEHGAPSPGRQREHSMNSVTSVPLVHYYDTTLRRILCGLRGPEHRSTKHSRSVTCDACVGLLRMRPAESDGRARSDAITAAPAPLGASGATLR
jgi:hypothetical protein